MSRQICLPTPDLIQEDPWGMDGPPPYSPVDLEQTLLVRSSYRHIYIYTHTRDKDSTDTQRSFVPPTPLPVINIRFQVQMIHGGIILQSKLSMSFKQYSRKAVLCCTPIDLLFFSPQRRHPNLYCFFEHSNLSCSTTEPR